MADKQDTLTEYMTPQRLVLPPAMSYTQAVILILNRNTKAEQDRLPCMFNPTEISVTKSGQWSEQPTASSNTGSQTFGGGRPGTLVLNNLIFDTTHLTGADRNIIPMMNKLLKLTVADDANPDPPLARFSWGNFNSFMANVPSVSIKYTLFLPDGTPVRAETSLTLNEQMDPNDRNQMPFQNPTSRSEARKTWVVVEGQTLPWIAYQEYGNAAHWRHIAETNRLANPLDLKPGQILKLVPLPAKR